MIPGNSVIFYDFKKHTDKPQIYGSVYPRRLYMNKVKRVRLSLSLSLSVTLVLSRYIVAYMLSGYNESLQKQREKEKNKVQRKKKRKRQGENRFWRSTLSTRHCKAARHTVRLKDIYPEFLSSLTGRRRLSARELSDALCFRRYDDVWPAA